MNLDDLTPEQLIARGKHATLSRARRREMSEITQLCAVILTATSRVVKDMQDERPEPDWVEVEKMVTGVERNMGRLREKIAELREIVEQRRSINSEAWGE